MTKLFSWSNFWVNRRKALDREKLIVEVCYHFGMPIRAFLALPRTDQDHLIDQYKLAKGMP